MNDALGLSKATTPDESQVAAGRSLSIPPDYSLKPPLDGPAPGTAEPVAAPTQIQTPTNTQTQATSAQQITPPATNGGQAAASTQTASNQAYGGISPTKPDGTRKTAAEIREEARQKQIEQERAKNPDYGTWKNIFNW